MTREEILEKAGNIIRDEGYDMLTISTLAESLGVKKASLYYHFSSKDEMIDALYESFSQKLLHMGFRMDFSKSAIEILTETFAHWKSIFVSPALSSGLSLVDQRKEIDERAFEINNSLELMFRAQSDAVMENLVSRGQFRNVDAKILGELFASASIVRLQSERSEEEDEEFLSSFSSLFSAT